MKYVLATVLVIVAITAMQFSYEGLCFSHWRFLSDAEMIEPAVRALGRENYIRIDPIDAKDFLLRNPDCCSVNRYPAQRMWLDVVTGWNISEIEVNFERNPKFLSAENYEKYYKQYISVSACGEVLKRGPGTSTHTLEKADRR
jgi:hypothetical protein